jgi:transposase
MIPYPSGARVWLAAGRTDKRKGFDVLALLIQETLKRDPHSGHLFVFRGSRGGLIKMLQNPGTSPFVHWLSAALGRGRRCPSCGKWLQLDRSAANVSATMRCVVQ